MKPRAMEFSGAEAPADAAREVLRVRFAECLQRQDALYGSDEEALHEFRLACKRLRFVLEREAREDYTPALEALSQVTDRLGEAHDLDVLASRARQCSAPMVEQRCAFDKAAAVRRAQRTWKRAFEPHGSLEAVARESGFSW